MAAKYELKKTSSGKFIFQLKAANGQIVMKSELYGSKASAKNGIKSAMKNGPKRKSFDVRLTKSGQPYFVLMAANNEPLAQSQAYKKRRGLNKGIKSVMRTAAQSRTVDLD